MGVLVPAARWARWVTNFEDRHGDTALEVVAGTLRGCGADGSSFVARLPWATTYAGPPTIAAFQEAVSAPATWGVLLVRKGGFSIARLAGERVVASYVGRRHVQGRTKAGGQSQQRFARRRDNQARQACAAAAEHAARLLANITTVVVGGDRHAIEQVLLDPRLRGLQPMSTRDDFESKVSAYVAGMPSGMATPAEVRLGARVMASYTVMTRADWALARVADGEGALAGKFRHPSVAPSLRALHQQWPHIEALLE